MKSGVAEPILQLMYMYKSFPINAAMQIFKLAMKKNAPLFARVATPLSIVVASGLVGLPGIKMAKAIVQGFKPGSDPEGSLRNYLAGAFEGQLEQAGVGERQVALAKSYKADLVTYGLPGLVGIDASRMFGLADFPFSSIDEIVGVPSSVTAGVVRAVKHLGYGRVNEAIKSALPLPMGAHIMEAVEWERDGEAKDSFGFPLLDENWEKWKPSKGEIAAKFAGLTLVKEARLQQKAFALSQIREHNRLKEAQYRDKISRALAENDLDTADAYIKEVMDHNFSVMEKNVKLGEELNVEDLWIISKESIRNRTGRFLTGRLPGQGVEKQMVPSQLEMQERR
jgi:hypothetical protein